MSFICTSIEQVDSNTIGSRECPVCLDEFSICKMMVSSCNHHLCTTCTSGILESTNKVKCPICRKECNVLKTEDMESFYDVCMVIRNKNYDIQESMVDFNTYEPEPDRLETLLSGGIVLMGNF